MAATRMMAGADGGLLAEQADVLEMIVRGSPLTDVLGTLCTIVEHHAVHPVRAAILLVDDDGRRLRSGAAPSLPEEYCRAVDGVPIQYDLGTCAAAAARAEVVITPDFETCSQWAKLKHLPLAHGLVGAWSMPIMSSTRTVLGTFGTYFFEKREPTAQERWLVEVLARTAALAIERDRSDRGKAASAARERFIGDLGAAMQDLSEPAEMMKAAARMLAEHLDADRCACAQIVDGTIFDVVGDHARGVPSVVGRWPMAAFGVECQRALHAGEAFVVTDCDTDPRITDADRAAYRTTSVRATVVVPLHKHGELTAMIAVHQKAPRTWSISEVDLVRTVAGRCWEALERTRVARTLRESEARYRAIVEATPECVKLVGPDGTLLQMNAAGLRMIEAAGEAEAVGQ